MDGVQTSYSRTGDWEHLHNSLWRYKVSRSNLVQDSEDIMGLSRPGFLHPSRHSFLLSERERRTPHIHQLPPLSREREEPAQMRLQGDAGAFQSNPRKNHREKEGVHVQATTTWSRSPRSLDGKSNIHTQDVSPPTPA